MDNIINKLGIVRDVWVVRRIDCLRDLMDEETGYEHISICGIYSDYNIANEVCLELIEKVEEQKFPHDVFYDIKHFKIGKNYDEGLEGEPYVKH